MRGGGAIAASGRRRSGSAFLPNSLSGLGGWWRADVITSPPADGGALQTWTDSSTAARNFTQATAGNRPVYRTTGTFLPNGKPCVEFSSSSSQYMTTASAASTNTFTRFAVLRFKTLTSALQVIYGGVSGQVISSAKLSSWRFNTVDDSAGNDIISWGATRGAVNTWYIVCWTDDGAANYYTYVNGPQDARSISARPSSSSSTSMTLGARNTGQFGTDGYIAEVVDYNRMLTDTERGQVFSYLGSKYGIPISTDPHTDLVLDWETGDYNQWFAGSGGLEDGTTQNPPGHQAIFSTTVVRGAGSTYSHRFEVHNDPGDIANATFRSLLAKYDSQEGAPIAQGPSDFAYGFSFRVAQEENVAARLQYNQIWELHHRAGIYNINGLQLAPHAIELYTGDITYRLATGAGAWNGSAWTGWSTYLPQQVLISNYSLNVWYDTVIRIKCSEGSDGIVQAYCRAAGNAWPGTPQFSHTGPSLPYVPGGLDPNVPSTISTSDVGSDGLTGLYLETGLYTGSGTWYGTETTQQEIIYFDGMRRYNTVAQAMAAFPP